MRDVMILGLLLFLVLGLAGAWLRGRARLRRETRARVASEAALRRQAAERGDEQRLWVSSLKQAMLNRILRLAFEPLSLQQ